MRAAICLNSKTVSRYSSLLRRAICRQRPKQRMPSLYLQRREQMRARQRWILKNGPELEESCSISGERRASKNWSTLSWLWSSMWIIPKLYFSSMHFPSSPSSSHPRSAFSKQNTARVQSCSASLISPISSALAAASSLNPRSCALSRATRQCWAAREWRLRCRQLRAMRVWTCAKTDESLQMACRASINSLMERWQSPVRKKRLAVQRCSLSSGLSQESSWLSSVESDSFCCHRMLERELLGRTIMPSSSCSSSLRQCCSQAPMRIQYQAQKLLACCLQQQSVTMNLKESLLVPALLALPAPPPPNDLEHEEQYLARLRESLSWIMGSVEASAREVGEKYVRREECERLLEEKEQAIAALQAENYQLRVGSEQCQRYLKRYEMKHELLSNKIYHLTKAIAEKDAIIKYLEGKTAPPPASTPTPTARPLNDSLHDCPRTYSKPNLSFAKLRSTSNLMTFEDYANCSLQLPNDPTKRARGDRVRTESSSDVKENESMDNIQPVAATSKLAGFFGTNMFGSLENQKTLTKAHSTTAQQNASFWQYSKPKQDGREQRRHSNFGNAAVPPNHFYRE